jgi:hypothetical protein
MHLLLWLALEEPMVPTLEHPCICCPFLTAPKMSVHLKSEIGMCCTTISVEWYSCRKGESTRNRGQGAAIIDLTRGHCSHTPNYYILKLIDCQSGLSINFTAPKMPATRLGFVYNHDDINILHTAPAKIMKLSTYTCEMFFIPTPLTT